MTNSVTAGDDWEDYLRRSAVPRDLLDDFLSGPSWAKFDAELGYTLRDSSVPWGIDGTCTIETFSSHGARTQFLYANQKPRINTYGDSFTECAQVNDGETWQEYLAGHLGEPIGNYGVGGYGVYQAYRRMIREEVTAHGAEHLILYIWGDDSIRSLMRARWAAIYPWFTEQARGKKLFHANCWANIEMDLSSGTFVEKASLLQTLQALYQMCDPDWMLRALYGDVAVHLLVYAGVPAFSITGKIRELDCQLVSRLAEILDFHFDWSNRSQIPSQALSLLNLYGQRATIEILDMARAFALKQKNICSLHLIALLGTSVSSTQMLRIRTRANAWTSSS